MCRFGFTNDFIQRSFSTNWLKRRPYPGLEAWWALLVVKCSSYKKKRYGTATKCSSLQCMIVCHWELPQRILFSLSRMWQSGWAIDILFYTGYRLPAAFHPLTCHPLYHVHNSILFQATFCAMTVTFCRRLNWGLLASCLETYTGRLGFGVRDELLPLVRMGSEVKNLKGRREGRG